MNRERHGIYRYSVGCRCVTCRAANTARQRRKRQARKRREPDWVETHRPRDLSLDRLLVDNLTTYDLIVPGVQRHMVEWLDPTADAALASVA